MKLSFLIQLVLLLVLIVGVFMVFTNSVNGRTKLIMIVFLLVIGVYLFTKLPFFRGYNELVETPVTAKEPYTISSENMKPSNGHYTFSTWVYIDDWNYNHGTVKPILHKIGADGASKLFNMQLGSYTNDLTIEVESYSTDQTGTSTNTIKIENINLQRWVNIIVSVNDRNVDVYLNGKLVKSEFMENVINTANFNASDLMITSSGGFGGYISKTRYYPHFITPKTAWSIYRDGFGDSLASALNKYNMSVTFYEDSIEKKKYWMF
jgi:hypothetical protein